MQPLVYIHLWWPAIAKAEVGNFPLSLDNGRSPHGYINQRLQIQFRAPGDERCAARNMFSLQWNFGIINSITKLHLVAISTESSTMHGSMNIKKMHRNLCMKIQNPGNRAILSSALYFKLCFVIRNINLKSHVLTEGKLKQNALYL